jgi:two-component system chemotaxis response regulator CheY
VKPVACFWLTDSMERGLVQLVLARAGYEPVPCTDREDTLKKVSSLHPKILLMDVILPGENGLEIIREIKTSQAAKAPQMIVVTSLAFSEVVSQAREAGAAGFIAKPIDSDLLYKRLTSG